MIFGSRRGRRLTSDERAVIAHLLSDDEQGFDALRAQLPLAVYERPWFPGSASFEMSVAGAAPTYENDATRTESGANLVAVREVYQDGAAPTEQTRLGALFLWVSDGRLSALEYASVDGASPRSLPGIDQLARAED